MKLSRLFLPLMFAFALLFAQQAGTMHLLSHVIKQSQQQDKHSPHSSVCEKCASYAQLGNALQIAIHDFTPLGGTSDVILFFAIPLLSSNTLTAAARGPPSILQ